MKSKPSHNSKRLRGVCGDEPHFAVSTGAEQFGPLASAAGRNRRRTISAFLWTLGWGFALAGLSAAPADPYKDLPEALTLTQRWALKEVSKVSQTGEVISRGDYQPAGWYPATVPGTVLTTLVNNGVYPEPLYGENNRPDKIPDSLARTAWWYRTTFVPPASYGGKQIWLRFQGINYSAEVWLNGHRVGDIQGAFTRGIFDATADVVSGLTNALAVLVSPQPHPGATHEKTVADGTGPNGGVTAQDGPTFLCSIGWDWIPTIRDRNTGLWQEVMLSATGPVVIQDPFVTTDLPLPRTNTADLTVQATVRNVGDKRQTGLLSGTIEDVTFQQEVTLGPRETRTVTFNPATTPALHWRQPKLWWPNGFGPQNLYKLHLQFSVDGVVSDAQGTTFGIRKITYALPGSENLALSVNGVPVISKGGDWGMDEALKRIPRRRLEAMVRMHQIANYTMIRNWVGQSTSADLYDLCDQYGILLWDEFFEPYPGDGPVPEDVGLYLANVREKMLRFRSHPCIALWCGRNEGDPPLAIGQGIQKLINELDPGRLYQPSSTSGRGVNSGGPYYWRTPREYYTYTEAFKTEIGSVSVPTLEAVRAMMPAQDWEVINDDWAEHDFCGGAQAGDQYPYLIAARYGAIASLADFVRKSQLANYESFRALYEGRFAKLFSPVTGVLTWMSSPAQPSFVWQLYSHDLEPNASLYATRKACEPVHIQMNQNDWHVMVINNTPESLAGLKVRTAVYSLEGRLESTRTNILTAAPSAATDAGAVAFPDRLSPVHFVQMELRDAQDRLLSDNFYWRAKPDQEDDFRALNNLPMVALEVRATRRAAGGQCRIDVALRNPSPSVALLSHLQLRKARSGGRVLPVFYSDNYVSLLPGERKNLTVEAAVADLAGEAPLLAVDGWNVTAKASLASGENEVQVVPNAEAMVHSEGADHPVSTLAVVGGINCGGSQIGFYRFGFPPPEFAQDLYFKGGKRVSSAATGAEVDAQVPKAAPGAVYQSARSGEFSYSIPIKQGAACTVRLHFAETEMGSGQRKFNVQINGRRVLEDFDIAGEAGKNKALVKEFPGLAPDAAGNLVIAFTRGSAGEPKICGIQILH